MRAALAAALLLALPVYASNIAEQIRFHTLDGQPGLSDGTIRAIAQDETGFLWVGTDKGLYRFDGYQVRAYREGGASSHGLENENVSDLLVDANGRLWVVSWTGGARIYNAAADRFERVGEAASGATLPDQMRSAARGRGGSVLIGTWGAGLYRVTNDGANVEAITGRPPARLPVDKLKVAEAQLDNDGNIWLAAWDRGLLRYDPGNGAWQQWLADDDGLTARQYGRVTALYRRGSTIWVGTDTGGVLCVDTRSLEIDCTIPLVPGYREQVRDLYLDDNAHLWIATLGGGLIRYSVDTGQRIQYTHNGADNQSLPSNDVFVLFEDDFGVLWVGTLGSGVSQFEIEGQALSHFKSDPLAASTLRSNAVRAMAETGGKVWIGTDGGGLHSYDPGTGEIAPFEIRGRVYSERIWALDVAANGELWVGTWGGGAYRIDTSSGDVVAKLPNQVDPGGDVVVALRVDRSDRAWLITSSSGLSMYDPDTQAVTRFLHDENDPHSLSSDSVSAIFEDTTGDIWIATSGSGLNRYVGDGRFERHLTAAASDGGLGRVTVLTLASLGDELWLGTTSGAARYRPEDRELMRLDDVPGAHQASVVEILASASGDAWLATDNGLYRYSTDPERVERYNRRDGIQAQRFNNGAALAASDGTLYFGGPNGFNRFEPNRVSRNLAAPRVVVTDVRLFNESLELSETLAGAYRESLGSGGETLQLSHEQNQLSFEFAALHFVAPEDNIYEYKLDGLPGDWLRTNGANRVAHYTNLESGDYLLHIRAASGDGVWSSSNAEYAFRIMPPWWQTGWAYTAYAVLTAVFLLGLVRWRTFQLRRHAELLRQQVREKTDKVREQNRTIDQQAQDLRAALDSKNHLFAQISHEFRTPLSLILGPLRELRRRNNERGYQSRLDLVERNTRRVLRLVEQLLGLASAQVDEDHQSVDIDASTVVDAIVDNFKGVAADKGVSISATLQPDVFVRADHSGFEQVLLNLVSNAIKYTPDNGEVSVTLERKDSIAEIQVRDTGIGIAESELDRVFEPFRRTGTAARGRTTGTGLGLAVVKERVQADDGSITLQSVLGEGTTVTVALPLSVGDPAELASVVTEATSLEVAVASAVPEAAAVEPALLTTDGTARILLADDSEDVLQLLVSELDSEYQCLTARDGEEALEIVREQLPDLVVSDVGMPKLDGFGLTREIKADDRSCHIPVVLLTARADEESRRLGYEERADIYITKPFDIEELKLRIVNLLALLSTRRQGLAARLLTGSVADIQVASDDLPDRDRRFMQLLFESLEQNHEDSTASMSVIAGELAMSERQLQRKTRALLNQAPGELLRLYRLDRACGHLRRGDRPADVAIAVGFSSQAHFGACFKARYGDTPGSFAKAARNA